MGKAKKFIQKLVAGGALLATLYGSPVQADDSEKHFFIGGAYVPTSESGVVRLKGKGGVYDLKAHGFLDLKGAERKLDLEGFFGKGTVEESLDQLLEGLSVSTELTVRSNGKDELRAGFAYRFPLAEGNAKVLLYPIAPKKKGPYLGVFINQELADQLDARAFITIDSKTGGYYGEGKVSYRINEAASLLLRTRYKGRFGKPFQPSPEIGLTFQF